MIKPDHYTYRVTWLDDDQEYVGLCAEFSSLSWLDESPEKSLNGIRKLVSGVVADMVASDEVIPEPYAHKKFSGKFQLRIPPESHRRLSIEAAEHNVSLNRYINEKLS